MSSTYCIIDKKAKIVSRGYCRNAGGYLSPDIDNDFLVKFFHWSMLFGSGKLEVGNPEKYIGDYIDDGFTEFTEEF